MYQHSTQLFGFERKTNLVSTADADNSFEVWKSKMYCARIYCNIFVIGSKLTTNEQSTQRFVTASLTLHSLPKFLFNSIFFLRILCWQKRVRTKHQYHPFFLFSIFSLRFFSTSLYLIRLPHDEKKNCFAQAKLYLEGRIEQINKKIQVFFWYYFCSNGTKAFVNFIRFSQLVWVL